MPGTTPVRVRKPMPLKGRFTSMPADAIGDDFSPGGANVRFRFGEVRSAPGREILSGPLVNEPVLKLGSFSLTDATTWTFMLTSGHLFRFGNLTPGFPTQWFVVVKAPPGVPPGTRIWSTAVGEDHLFFARGDDIFQWDGIATHSYGVITPSSGTVPNARFLAYFNNRLIALYTTEGGNTFCNRARWSQNGDFTAWDDTAGLGAGFLDFFDPDELEIRGALQLGNDLIIYTRSAILRMFPTGSLDPTFGVTVMYRGTGCNAPYTIQSSGQRHFYLGYDRNVWSWDGVRAVPVGTPIYEELKSFAHTNNVDSYFATVAKGRQEYWLAVEGGNVFVYDYERDYWTRDTFPSITAIGEVDTVVNPITWLTITTTWDTETRTWEELEASIVSALIGGTAVGGTMIIDDATVYDYFAIGSIMDRYVETPDYYFDDIMETGNVLRMLLVYQFTTDEAFEVGISVDRGFSWETQFVVPTANGLSLISFNTTGEIVRFRFRENSATARFRWRSMQYEFSPAGTFIGSV